MSIPTKDIETIMAKIEAGDVDGAIQHAENVIKKSKTPRETALLCYRGMGRELSAEGDHAGSARCYARLVGLDPGDLFAWLSLGDAYLFTMDVDNGLAAYQKALELDPTNPGAYFGIANLYFACGLGLQPEGEHALEMALKHKDRSFLQDGTPENPGIKIINYFNDPEIAEQYLTLLRAPAGSIKHLSDSIQYIPPTHRYYTWTGWDIVPVRDDTRPGEQKGYKDKTKGRLGLSTKLVKVGTNGKTTREFDFSNPGCPLLAGTWKKPMDVPGAQLFVLKRERRKVIATKFKRGAWHIREWRQLYSDGKLVKEGFAMTTAIDTSFAFPPGDPPSLREKATVMERIVDALGTRALDVTFETSEDGQYNGPDWDHASREDNNASDKAAEVTTDSVTSDRGVESEDDDHGVASEDDEAGQDDGGIDDAFVDKFFPMPDIDAYYFYCPRCDQDFVDWAGLGNVDIFSTTKDTAARNAPGKESWMTPAVIERVKQSRAYENVMKAFENAKADPKHPLAREEIAEKYLIRACVLCDQDLRKSVFTASDMATVKPRTDVKCFECQHVLVPKPIRFPGAVLKKHAMDVTPAFDMLKAFAGMGSEPGTPVSTFQPQGRAVVVEIAHAIKDGLATSGPNGPFPNYFLPGNVVSKVLVEVGEEMLASVTETGDDGEPRYWDVSYCDVTLNMRTVLACLGSPNEYHVRIRHVKHVSRPFQVDIDVEHVDKEGGSVWWNNVQTISKAGHQSSDRDHDIKQACDLVFKWASSVGMLMTAAMKCKWMLEMLDNGGTGPWKEDTMPFARCRVTMRNIDHGIEYKGDPPDRRGGGPSDNIIVPVCPGVKRSGLQATPPGDDGHAGVGFGNCFPFFAWLPCLDGGKNVLARVGCTTIDDLVAAFNQWTFTLLSRHEKDLGLPDRKETVFLQGRVMPPRNDESHLPARNDPAANPASTQAVKKPASVRDFLKICTSCGRPMKGLVHHHDIVSRCMACQSPTCSRCMFADLCPHCASLLTPEEKEEVGRAYSKLPDVLAKMMVFGCIITFIGIIASFMMMLVGFTRPYDRPEWEIWGSAGIIVLASIGIFWITIGAIDKVKQDKWERVAYQIKPRLLMRLRAHPHP